MRIILYVRASTEDQHITLDAQVAKLQAYAALYELEVVASIIDAGESAKSLNRPGLQRALTMLRKGEADGLAVTKLDRLTRNIADWQELIDDYFGDKAGKQLYSVSESISTATAAGRMVLNIMLTIAQWERETIAERTREALQHKIAKGEHCGNARFGYDIAPDGKTVVPNAAEQRALQIMRELRAGGMTLNGIATELGTLGVPTKRGGPWNPIIIRRILKRGAA